MGGNRAWIPLARTDLAVPRLPARAMPPIAGSIAASSKAVLIASCPTTAAKGNAIGVEIFVTKGGDDTID